METVADGWVERRTVIENEKLTKSWPVATPIAVSMLTLRMLTAIVLPPARIWLNFSFSITVPALNHPSADSLHPGTYQLGFNQQRFQRRIFLTCDRRHNRRRRATGAPDYDCRLPHGLGTDHADLRHWQRAPTVSPTETLDTFSPQKHPMMMIETNSSAQFFIAMDAFNEFLICNGHVRREIWFP